MDQGSAKVSAMLRFSPLVLFSEALRRWGDRCLFSAVKKGH
jgi:hypothetical protein